ncbi:MAG: tyrosine/phenylalanine carboxypeptidase domain-containing protein [Polyangiales bacterium]
MSDKRPQAASPRAPARRSKRESAGLSEKAEAIASAIRERVADGGRLRRTLPGFGRLNIDRPLPFIAVHIAPDDRRDAGTHELVTTEASYLYASADSGGRKRAGTLVHALAETVRPAFGNQFLIVAVVSRPPEHSPVTANSKESPQPAFRLFSSSPGYNIDSIMEVLERHLKAVEVGGRRAVVEVVQNGGEFPHRDRPLLNSEAMRRLGCAQITIEVEPIYQMDGGGDVYPAVLKQLRRRLGPALKHAFFYFAERDTSLHPKNFQSLGRRALVKAVWDVDTQLDEVASRFDLLLEVNPINTEAVWNGFRQSHFEKVPPFRYRPLSVDPVLAKRKLYSIPLERIEDPTISFLFSQKQEELDRQLTMLHDRGTPRFLLGSILLYERVSKELVRSAEEILEQISSTTRAPGGGGTIPVEEFAKQARAELEHYRSIWDGVDATVEVVPGVSSGLMVSKGRLLVPSRSRIPRNRVDALIQHEIGTHLVTYYNGKAQRFTQLRNGFAGYEELQEGIAVLAEYLAGGMTPARLRTLAARVIGVDALTNGASFVDVFRLLCRYGFSRQQAFNITIRIFRGGGLIKDCIYLRGLLTVLEYLKKGGEFEPLFVGKIAAKHIPIVRELQSRKVLDAPKFLPRYVTRDSCQERLQLVRQGLNVYELLD